MPQNYCLHLPQLCSLNILPIHAQYGKWEVQLRVLNITVWHPILAFACSQLCNIYNSSILAWPSYIVIVVLAFAYEKNMLGLHHAEPWIGTFASTTKALSHHTTFLFLGKPCSTTMANAMPIFYNASIPVLAKPSFLFDHVL